MAGAPRPAAGATRSTIKVGVFDGGIDLSVPLLHGHAEEDASLAINTPAVAECTDHATAIAGAVLHGALNGTRPRDRLPPPPVYVVSIRVLPTSDPLDVDLYESIDVIEKAVPVRKDIKVFSISFGPRGPIQEDPISRFTYVLDVLAHSHKVTFCVAAGNDGEVAGEERIQAPSDLVHGLGVGAFTLNGSAPVHAPYSCRGPGRECGKVKPDVVAFGGCENTPMHLVSTSAGMKVLDWGTSFATPLVSRLTAQAIESFDRGSALLARALIVHTATHPDTQPDALLGHGCIVESVDDLLLCEDRAVTVVFQGDILPTRIVQLPIPWPSSIVIPGKIQITWTVAALAPVDPMHPGDYTSCCLEETFYPQANRYQFRPPKNSKDTPKSLDVGINSAEIKQLRAKGWTKAEWPLSESGNEYRDEEQRRKLDCKWESIVRRTKSKYANKIHSPFMTLHAIGRNGVRREIRLRGCRHFEGRQI